MNFTTNHYDRRTILRGLIAVSASSVATAVAGSLAPMSALAGAGSNALSAGQTLNVGQSLVSTNGGLNQLVMQGDGNLVVYTNGRALWTSNTAGNPGSRLVCQTDGNLVIYSPSNVPIFVTGTGGNAGGFLAMQTDSNCVLYAADGRPLWYTNSSAERAIQWYYNHRYSTSYDGKCELAVENAFGTSGRYNYAIDNWNARVKHYPCSAAPRGALVFYNTSSKGHVAISLGNRKIISTSAVSNRTIDVVPISYFQNPLGWAYAPW